MNQQRALIIRILIAAGIVYAGWSFVVRPAHAKLVLLRQDRQAQKVLVSQAGQDFETRRVATNEAYKMVSLAGDRVISVLATASDQQNAREMIGSSARLFSVGINRIEPLREIEFTNAMSKNRYKSKGKKDTKSVRFVGEGVRVELDGTFPNIAGFLHHLDQNSQTMKMETFRMVSSGDGRSRMIAQFMKYELVEAPLVFAQTDGSTTP